MRKVFAFQFMSIDGIGEFVAYPDDWSSGPDEGNALWAPYMPEIDTLFLGRRTFEIFAEYWPRQKDEASASEWTKEFSRFYDRVEKVVFSKSLRNGVWPNSRIARGPIEAEVARLRETPGGTMAVVGGPRLFQSFLAADLIDDMFLGVFPSIVQHGKPLFRLQLDPDAPAAPVLVGAPDRHDFRAVDARATASGEVFLHYRRVPKGA
ncbi:MAG TPA: dihydrofolate reductase family protein [Thermoplasmata archaeon]|nr:dihydrofolate reductase family protein [Thermoplasmata archaeon]